MHSPREAVPRPPRINVIDMEDDVIGVICSYLQVPDLIRLQRTCSFLYYTAKQELDALEEKVNAAEDLLYGRNGLPQNSPSAVQLMKAAAERVHPRAMYFVGVWHLYPVSGVHKDEPAAHEYLKKAASMGNILARVMCLQRGIGCAADPVAAFRLLLTADPDAPIVQNELGWCYADGVGVAKDLKKAARCFQVAADEGFAAAQNNLGALYYDGLGVPKDPAVSASWFLKAAEQGHASAQCSLGSCYYDGYGVERNGVKAIEWYRRAADQGVAVGQYCLGMCYENGVGVAVRDQKMAIYWFRCAAVQGHALARDALKRLGIDLAALSPPPSHHSDQRSG